MNLNVHGTDFFLQAQRIGSFLTTLALYLYQYVFENRNRL